MEQTGKKAIVVTTINAPTEAVRELAAFGADWPLIVIGDNKTPADWALENARFVSMDEQRALPYAVAPLLPENHYCRKNIGYLLALEQGLERLAETDDDNLPGGWPLDSATLEVEGGLVEHDGWVNVYEYFTEHRIWPRGFPLDRIDRAGSAVEPRDARWKSSIQQYLAAGDPDVDAIYRLTVGKDDHVFADRTIGLDAGAAVPFNSQSTLWFAEAFPYLYLPSHVSFRMTDIWRSFVAQVCLWAVGDRLSYHGVGVKQVRNDHDLMRDFDDEVVGYQRNTEIMEALTALPLSPDVADAASNLLTCYRELNRIGVVPDQELPLVEGWVDDVRNIRERMTSS